MPNALHLADTLAKTIGVSQMQRVGHLSELRQALALTEQGVKVLAIGRRFDDGLKLRHTDIDLFAQQGRVVAAVELKAYGRSDMHLLNGNAPRDMASIRVFCNSRRDPNRCVPIFAISERPGSQMDTWLQKKALENEVQLVYGAGAQFSEQVSKIMRQIQ